MTDLLRVVANPFRALDHEGQPAATFPFDPEHARGSRRWVGARIDLSPAADGKPRTRALERPWDMMGKRDVVVNGRVRSEAVRIGSAPDQRTVFAFDLSPQDVLVTEHYMRGVRHGDIIAADPETAKRCGVPFVEPDKALRAAAAKAIADHENAHGAPPPVATWAENLAAYAMPAEAEKPAKTTPEPAPVTTTNAAGGTA